MAYHVVLVGTDGSQSSYRAVDRAAEVALRTGAALVLVCAYQPAVPRGRRQAGDVLGEDAYPGTGSHPAADVLGDAAARAEIVGLDPARITSVPAAGDAVTVLLALASEHDADLVVVGNRGRDTLTGRLLGSVPASVARKVGCDVLIVHTPARGR